MARCRLTKMNLRNIRKSREYQCMVIDLVGVGVLPQSSAESILGYSIPAGLLDETGSQTQEPEQEPDDDDETTDDTVTITIKNDGKGDVEDLETVLEVTVPAGSTFADVLAAEADENNSVADVLDGRTVCGTDHEAVTTETVFTEDTVLLIPEDPTTDEADPETEGNS